MSTLDLTHLTPEENKRFNEIAHEIRTEFNLLIETISLPHVHNLNWMVGSLASRNKYTSPLFVRLCTLAFIEKELVSSHIDAIVVADAVVAKKLKEHHLVQHKKIKIQCTKTLFANLWEIGRPVRQYLIASVLFFLRYISSRFKNPVKRLPKHDSITLIDTFILNNKSGDEGSLNNGIYKDRYYPGLLDHLTEDEKKHIIFLPTIVGFKNPFHIFKQIRNAKTSFMVHDDFLKLSDYLLVLVHPFRLLTCKIPEINFRSFNVGSLLRTEHRRNCSEMISLLGVLYYRFAYRLSEKKIRVRLLIEWYENQVMDRGMIVGFHRFHPGTRIIGYQGYIIAKSLHVYTVPNATEKLGQAVPDVISVVGEGLKENIFEFCKEVNVNVAPGFRFQRLWRTAQQVPDANHFTVLVGLPIHLQDSAHILRLLAQGLSLLQDRKMIFWIKPHPTWGPESIKKLLPEKWPDEFHFKIGDFHDSLECANLLITNASSVSLEALAKGVPVIIIGAQVGINQNPIPENIANDMWSLVYSMDECIKEINRYKNMNHAELQSFKEKSHHIRERFFQPVNRENVVKFLEMQ